MHFFILFLKSAKIKRDGIHEIDWSAHDNMENRYIKFKTKKIGIFEPMK